ncbi:MAG TPA: hypothetical protein VF704_10540 [Allosphingosinicella sp.]
MEKVRFVVEELPELDTEVAIAGSVKQQEVGGAICLAMGATIAIYLAKPF